MEKEQILFNIKNRISFEYKTDSGLEIIFKAKPKEKTKKPILLKYLE